jgi:hypothetical protein
MGAVQSSLPKRKSVQSPSVKCQEAKLKGRFNCQPINIKPDIPNKVVFYHTP